MRQGKENNRLPPLTSSRLLFQEILETERTSIQELLQDEEVVRFDLGNPIKNYDEVDTI